MTSTSAKASPALFRPYGRHSLSSFPSTRAVIFPGPVRNIGGAPEACAEAVFEDSTDIEMVGSAATLRMHERARTQSEPSSLMMTPLCQGDTHFFFDASMP